MANRWCTDIFHWGNFPSPRGESYRHWYCKCKELQCFELQVKGWMRGVAGDSSARFSGGNDKASAYAWRVRWLLPAPHMRLLIRRNCDGLPCMKCTSTWAPQWLGLYVKYWCTVDISLQKIFNHIGFRITGWNFAESAALEGGTCHFITRMGFAKSMFTVARRFWDLFQLISSIQHVG